MRATRRMRQLRATGRMRKSFKAANRALVGFGVALDAATKSIAIAWKASDDFNQPPIRGIRNPSV